MNTKRYTIGFIQPVISQPRYRKRVEALKRLGFNAKILSFQREYYPGKQIEDELIVLGKVAHGKYLQRISRLIRAFRLTRMSLRDVDIVYAFGLDMLTLGQFASFPLNKKKKFVYEVGDIRSIFIGKHLRSKILRSVERFLARRIDLLVITSRAYLDNYFRALLHLRSVRCLIVENKVEDYDFAQTQLVDKKQKTANIHIGYFGLIRCERSWEILKNIVAKSNGRFKVLVRGIPKGIVNLEAEISSVQGITYEGPFVSPDNLQDMYAKVDLVWVIAKYHEKKVNHLLWARSNRFYEACYFKKPIIAQEGTIDGQMVSNYGIGVSLDLSDISAAAQRVFSINHADIRQWERNLDLLDKSVYCYTDEHEQLMNMIS